MSTYVQGWKVTGTQYRFELPTDETLHLIRKLRWIGMEGEAEHLQREIQEVAPTGDIITVKRETD